MYHDLHPYVRIENLWLSRRAILGSADAWEYVCREVYVELLCFVTTVL